MKHLLDWFRTLAGRWQHWMSGSGFGGAVVAVVGIYERFSGKTISTSIYLLMFVVCFLVGASFMAWRDEHKALIDLRKRLQAPKFTGEITTAILSQDGRSFALAGFISNPAGPPSAVIRWRAELATPIGSIPGVVMPNPHDDHRIDLIGTPDRAELAKENYWVLKSAQPIPAGGLSDGWVLVSFATSIPSVIGHAPEIRIAVLFDDVVATNTHVLSKTIAIADIVVGSFLRQR